MICKICDRKFKSIRGLCSHVSGSHKITSQDYYNSYLLRNNEDVCNLHRCEKRTTYINMRDGYSKFCSNKCSANSKEFKLIAAKNGRRNGKLHKGKTYEEIYGKEKANILKKSRSLVRKGKPLSEEHKLKMSETRKRRGCGIGNKNGMWGKGHTQKVKKKQSEYMLSGGAAHARSFLKKISKPQLELFKVVCQVAPYPVLEYPCLNKSIDIAIPQLSIAIEYDESYFHQDKIKDLKRQELLEGEGWKFIRYNDRIPSCEELIEDIINI